MFEINNPKVYINDNYKTTQTGSSEKEPDINLEDISIMYTTDKKEENRSSFYNTFDEVPLEQSQTGQKFLDGLKSNKTGLMQDLNLSDEEYDKLACVALALASQETGMGEEKGYNSENKGFGKFIRGILKAFDSSSASSGVTQMKIYDFLNSDDKLTENEKEIIKKYGIVAEGKSDNNLYTNPDKCAIATMVVLSSIANKYDDYKETLANEHQKLEDNFASLGITPETALKTGEELLNNIQNVYENISDDKTQIQFRETIKQIFLSVNKSKKGTKGVDKDYNEEVQLEKLNDILKSNSAEFSLDGNSLDYLRFALTSNGQEMTKSEYCAYGWNKGTGETGMQLDRLLADKIGTILATPENFDYDQFTVNVNTLANMYAYQSVDSVNAVSLGYSLGELIT